EDRHEAAEHPRRRRAGHRDRERDRDAHADEEVLARADRLTDLRCEALADGVADEVRGADVAGGRRELPAVLHLDRGLRGVPVLAAEVEADVREPRRDEDLDAPRAVRCREWSRHQPRLIRSYAAPSAVPSCASSPAAFASAMW